MPLFQERFWSKVAVVSPRECWYWTGAQAGKHYGAFWLDHSSYVMAHRFAYELMYGPIPEHLFVCHTCDTPLCVNPAHLWLGSKGDNNRDRAAKGRSAQGENNGQSKLTADQVQELRTRAAHGEPITRLARAFGVDNK